MDRNYNARKVYREYLGVKELPIGYEVHHKIRVADGGGDEIENLVLVGTLDHCNIHRGDESSLGYYKKEKEKKTVFENNPENARFTVRRKFLFEHETEIIELLKNGYGYKNISQYFNGEGGSDYTVARFCKKFGLDVYYNSELVKIRSNEKMSELCEGKNNPFFGKTHSDENKKKFRERTGEKSGRYDKSKYSKELKEIVILLALLEFEYPFIANICGLNGVTSIYDWKKGSRIGSVNLKEMEAIAEFLKDYPCQRAFLLNKIE